MHHTSILFYGREQDCPSATTSSTGALLQPPLQFLVKEADDGSRVLWDATSMFTVDAQNV